jgi:hypothetical protein
MSVASKYVDEFLAGMETSGVTLYNKVIPEVRSMETNEIGLVGGSYNTGVVNGIAGEMISLFDSPAYEKRIERLIDSLPKISAEVIQRHKTNIPPEVIDQMVALQDSYQYALSGAVDDQQVEWSIVSPYVNDAFLIIGRGGSLDSLETRTRELKDALTHYFVTAVTTLLEQFERELVAMIADVMNATRYRYVGPTDERNRDFCSDRVGREFTESEIETWPDEDWAGKIPGTDAFTIYTNLGGYNCRHILEPIKP